jgi:ubiquinone/menaquinone biosynthesis C-methylase UbiE
MSQQIGRNWIAAVAAVLYLVAPLGARQDHQEAPRDQWQRAADVFEAMGLGPGSVVADLGAGSGWFTTRLASAVGTNGRVYAVDVNPVSLRELREALPKELTNIEIVRGDENDPKLPAGQLDAVLVVNAYHEFAEYAAVLDNVRAALKPGGRLVLIEPTPLRAEDTTRAAQAKRHQIAIEFAEADLTQAGFEIVRKELSFVKRPAHQMAGGVSHGPIDWLLVARRPADSRLFEP